MDHPGRSRAKIGRVAARVIASVALGVSALLPVATPAFAADVTLTAEAMLGGNVRPGAWAGVNVHLENGGPAVDGELRIRSGTEETSTSYGVAVQLPTGARQDHTLYGQPGFFGGRFTVTFVSGGTALASQEIRVQARDPYSPSVFVIAERPEGILGDVRDATQSPQFSTPSVQAIGPGDLPPRVEAWAAIDRLVWQDVDSTSLTREQLDALQTWVSAGGRLVIVGGTTGTTTLSAFPDEMLPFRPTETVDATPADLAALLGTTPSGPTTIPAVAGVLQRGAVLARSGDNVIAATTGYGQGYVTLVEIDPSSSWLVDAELTDDLWSRLMPAFAGPSLNPLAVPDDSVFVGTLNNLPVVALPSIEQLFLLLLGYIALIGPINYLVLRRLDRREWAWVTMPVLVAIFAVAAYAVGIGLKGTDVIVNELAIVRGAAGTDRGIGQVYIGVFSPARATYDVQVEGGALLSNPVSLQQQGNAEQPIDVILGDPSHLRAYQVGFGVLRGFRAEASVASPRVDSELRLEESRLTGTIVNRSDLPLEHVAVLFGGGVQLIGDLAAGESKAIDFEVTAGVDVFEPLSRRLFGTDPAPDSETARTLYTRRTVVDQLSSYTGKLASSAASENPVILAWRSTGTLSVQLGVPANTVGDTLYMLPARAAISGPVVFPDDLIADSMVESDAADAFNDGSSYSLGQGTMTVEARPIGVSGSFAVDELELAITQGEPRPLRGDGVEVSPLPDDQQPPQDDPLALDDDPTAAGGEEPSATDEPAVVVPPGGGVVGGQPGAPGADPAVPPVDGRDFDGVPDIQLFDREAARWVEFPHFDAQAAYRIRDAQRYVDDSGALLVRFVNRADPNDGGVYFSFHVRMAGSVR